MNIFLLLALLFLAAIIVFIFQNPAPVVVQFLYWQSAEISISLLILVSVCAGALLCFIVDSLRAFSLNRNIRLLEKENQRLQQEIKRYQEAAKMNMPNEKEKTD